MRIDTRPHADAGSRHAETFACARGGGAVALELIATASNRGERRGQRKGGALDQSFANRRTDRTAVARHGERSDKIPCVVRVDQQQGRAVPPSDGVRGGGEGGGAGERGDQKIPAGEAAKRNVERRVVESRVRDPFTVEFCREGEVRLDAAPMRDEGGESGREPRHRWVRWGGDEEDPHGGDDGILASRADRLSDQQLRVR